MGNTCFNKTSNNKTSEIKIICTQCNTLKLENDGLFKIIYDDLYFHTNNRVSYISDDIYDKYGNKIEFIGVSLDRKKETFMKRYCGVKKLCLKIKATIG